MEWVAEENPDIRPSLNLMSSVADLLWRVESLARLEVGKQQGDSEKSSALKQLCPHLCPRQFDRDQAQPTQSMISFAEDAPSILFSIFYRGMFQV